MDEATQLHRLFLQPAIYRIRVCGRLDPQWSERLSGMTLTVKEEEGGLVTTELTGRLPDQAALMGVLQQLYLILAPLISMEYVRTCP